MEANKNNDNHHGDALESRNDPSSTATRPFVEESVTAPPPPKRAKANSDDGNNNKDEGEDEEKCVPTPPSVVKANDKDKDEALVPVSRKETKANDEDKGEEGIGSLPQKVLDAFISVYTVQQFGRGINDPYTGPELAVDGHTPLMEAIRRSDGTSIFLLFQCQDPPVDVHATTPRGWTALHVAVCNLNTEAVRTLLAHGANVNAAAITLAGREGVTVLHVAAQAGNMEVVRILLAHGADVNAIANEERSVLRNVLDPFGGVFVLRSMALTPLLSAVTVGCSVLPRLAHSSGKPTYAAQRNRLEIMKILLHRGADVNGTAKENSTSGITVRALYFAVKKGEEDIVKLLLENGADANLSVYTRGYLHESALHVAAFWGHVAIGQLLLDHGANSRAVAGDGNTPRQRAIRNGHNHMEELLRNALNIG